MVTLTSILSHFSPHPFNTHTHTLFWKEQYQRADMQYLHILSLCCFYFYWVDSSK